MKIIIKKRTAEEESIEEKEELEIDYCALVKDLEEEENEKKGRTEGGMKIRIVRKGGKENGERRKI